MPARISSHKYLSNGAREKPKGGKSKKKEMKWWGFCWKSPREWTLLVCHARVGRVPVITVYAQRRSERDEPATARWLQTSGGRGIPHALLSHMVRHYPKQIGLGIMVSIRKPNTRRSSKDHHGQYCFSWAFPTSSADNKDSKRRPILINTFADGLWMGTDSQNS